MCFVLFVLLFIYFFKEVTSLGQTKSKKRITWDSGNSEWKTGVLCGEILEWQLCAEQISVKQKFEKSTKQYLWQSD